MSRSFLALCVAALFLSSGHVSAATGRYDGVVQKMREIAAKSPEIVSVFSLGTNDQGREIFGLRFERPDRVTTKGSHLVIGAHHGNEELSTDVSMRFAEDLLTIMENPDAPTHGELRDNVFFVVPVLNLSGYEVSRRTEMSRTGDSLDSNRDYPDPCGPTGKFKLASTRALADLVTREAVVGAVTVHGYIGTFTYPWGTFTSESHTLDHDFFRAVGREAVAVNGYRTGTHGDEIYPTEGAFEDWAYYQHGVWVMLLELRRRADIGRDAQAMLKYFSLLPNSRSVQHEHTGDCRGLAPHEVIRSRP